MTRERTLLVVALLAVAPLLPFLHAAVSIDAPVFLAVARQIAVAPLDPFGFDMIWDPVSPHAAFFNHNPPLLSYYLVPWIALFGEWEPALHAALLPFPLIAALAFAGIARRLVGDALGPAVLLVSTPAFLVLASTLLLDVPVLACMLVSVYALLRAREGSPARWQLVAGVAAAAAGLVKYVGFATAPLLAAGVVLLLPPGQRPAALLRCVGVPLALWAGWGAWTDWLYGAVHYAGGLMLVGEKGFDPDEFWNQLFSVPIYYGGALIFPLLAALSSVRRGGRGAELAVVGILAGGAVVRWVLPEGEPLRRHPLGADQAVAGAAFFAGACFVWGLALRPGRALASAEDRFLAIWLLGFLVFSVFVNWHVNAADALLAAPALLLFFRDEAARPSRRAVWVWVGLTLPLSMALAWADALQGDVYRTVASRIAVEIGESSGARWFVGHWGFQYYLEREGFAAVVPPQYERSYGRSELAVDDWVASARNVSQLDVRQNLARYRMRHVWSWSEGAPNPLRTTNPDANAGFYSHHAGYLPFGWTGGPLEQIGLGRVTSAKAR